MAYRLGKSLALLAWPLLIPLGQGVGVAAATPAASAYREDCAPSALAQAPEGVRYWIAGQDQPILLTAEVAIARHSEGLAPGAIPWTLTVLTMNEMAVRSTRGATRLQENHASVSVRFDGRTDSGEEMPPGRYVYRLDIAGVQSTGGFLDVLPKGSIVPRLPEDVLQRSSVPANASIPWKLFYGAQHAHTTNSDGGIPVASCTGASSGPHAGATPADAFRYAKEFGGIDWLCILDHNHEFGSACGASCTNQQIADRYHAGLAAADAETTPTFVGIYGQEWGVTTNGGHVGLYDMGKLLGWDAYAEVNTPEFDYAALWTTCNTPSYQGPFGSTGSFCHPGSGDFGSFVQNSDGLAFLKGIAVISGPYTETSEAFADTGTRYAGPRASNDWYKYVLKRNWRVGPEAHQDNHCYNYGSSTRNRTVALAKALTKADLMDAMKNRRFYATSDMNVQAYFGLADTSRTMGDIFGLSSATADFMFWIKDPDGASISTVQLFKGNPATPTVSPTALAMNASGPDIYTLNVTVPATGELYYYIYATLSNGGEIWTAPIWLSRCSSTVPPPMVLDTVRCVKGVDQAMASWAPPATGTVHHYRVYGADTPGAPFPSGWTLLGTPAETAFSSSLSGGSRFILVSAVDPCGNESAVGP